MIKNSTVLILGAGASCPYGLPLGAELRNSICGMADGHSALAFALHKYADIDIEEIKNFARQFQRSHIKSIDAFLAKRSEFTDIGRLAIAAALIEKENPEKLLNAIDTEHWYSYMWNLMIQDINDISQLQFNKIKFITFNYDRSLEYFLLVATRNTFGVDDEKAQQALKGLGVLHVYGSLGNFHYLPSAGARQYLDDLNQKSLHTAANGIEIIPEARDDGKAFMSARSLCAEAVNIGFLGFGFDPLNIDRLGLADVLKWRKENNRGTPRIVASTLGVTHAEMLRHKNQICPNDIWEPLKDNCLMTLRESTLLG
jgi:hypothetical protein